MPPGVRWAVLGLTVMLTLIHGVNTIKGLVGFVRSLLATPPKHKSVASILSS